jgi:hypothetical protein
MFMSSAGNMRVDMPTTSFITNPAAQQTILLDHLKKEATVIPMQPPPPPGAPPLAMPQMPAGIPAPAPPQVEDLGKSMIEGHAVQGLRFTLPPPPAAQIPKPPQMPQAPQAPGMPQLPKPPALPTPPPIPKPTVTEVWTSVALKTPVLTKVVSAAGEQTTYCKPTSTAEPHPSLFQIPPGYKLKTP